LPWLYPDGCKVLDLGRAHFKRLAGAGVQQRNAILDFEQDPASVRMPDKRNTMPGLHCSTFRHGVLCTRHTQGCKGDIQLSQHIAVAVESGTPRRCEGIDHCIMLCSNSALRQQQTDCARID
jgi:hypothetical protein